MALAEGGRPAPGPRPLRCPSARRTPMGATCLEKAPRPIPRYGLEVVVIEDTAPMDDVRLGRPGRDEQIEWFCTQLKAMGELGIPTLCYNWVAITSWARTSISVPLRGGALSSGYDDEVMRQAPPLVEPGSITHEQLWEAYEYFLRAVVPVAEEAGVRLSLHPDDPPISAVRGVPRIMGSPEAFERVLALVPSPNQWGHVLPGQLHPDDGRLTRSHPPARPRRAHFFLALQGRKGRRPPVCRGFS